MKYNWPPSTICHVQWYYIGLQQNYISLQWKNIGFNWKIVVVLKMEDEVEQEKKSRGETERSKRKLEGEIKLLQESLYNKDR